MDQTTAKKLCAQNTRFYAANAASFSQTRNAPWDGWRRCLDACHFTPHIISVLDIACGNLRFEAFLEREYPAIDWRFFAIDNCEPLVDSGEAAIAEKVNFIREDIIGDMLDGLPAVELASTLDALSAGEPANTPASAQTFPFDLVVSFGFMHHIPGFDLRVQFLKEALSYTKPGGHLAVSFWQFLNDDARRVKAQRTHTEALEFFSGEHLALRPDDLEAGDYLLGWKNEPGQYRYCHHFSDEEIDRFIAELAPYANVATSFTADGKTGNLNRYVVFHRA